MAKDAESEKVWDTAGYSPKYISHNAYYAGNHELADVTVHRDPLDAKAWMTPRHSTAAAHDDTTPTPAHDPLDPSTWRDGGWMRGRESTLNAVGSPAVDERSGFGRQRLPEGTEERKIDPAPAYSPQSTLPFENRSVSVCGWLWVPAERGR